jgi:transposase
MMNDYSSKDLDHLGIVSVMCDEIGLVETIDREIPPDCRAQLSTGECVKLMVINGLGFSSRPLYLESQFYYSKPIERFLGRSIDVDEITDDRLGRALDRCFEHGCSQLFARVATKAALRCNVDRRFRHLDTTSMHVHGEYCAEEGLGLVTFGYSKDHRPDLKQFMISLMCSQDGDVPLLAETIAGNSSDNTHFRETLNNLKEQISQSDNRCYYVADSALYVEKTIAEISGSIKWISRVPERVKAAKELIAQIGQEHMTTLENGYSVTEVGATYGGVAQRWVLVYSEQAFQREQKTVKRNVGKELATKRKELRAVCSGHFDCEADAREALLSFSKKLKYHRSTNVSVSEKPVHKGRGRPKKDAPRESVYKLAADLVEDVDKVQAVLCRKGKFIVATNELDEGQLSATDLLSHYKKQQSVERGFRFLKDPLFMTSSLHLKNQQRIVALAMIMCLCLLVYSLAQRLLRTKISDMETSIPDQRGKPTTRPTMRWVFQIFEGVHLLIHRTADGVMELVLNLNPIRLRILEILGEPFQKIYSNSA